MSIASFVKSSKTPEQCPPGRLPELAFIGRSNVGKSSLINMLCSQKGLAKTSATPGKTRLINHYLVQQSWHLVDLPGYGYARVSKAERAQYETMISGYMLNRLHLACVFVLIDSRLPPQRIDVEFVNWLGENSVPLAIVFTKMDKLKKELAPANELLTTLSMSWESLPPVFYTSAVSGLGQGELWNYMQQIVSNG